MTKNVLIIGGSGFIGQELSKQLLHLGYKIKHLSRKINKKNKFQSYVWDIKNKIIPKESLKNIDVIIYLAGEPIDKKRWTKNQKKKILLSRIEGTKLIFNKIKKYCIFPKIFICTSGISYYGSITVNKFFTENNSAEKKDFLSEMSKNLEETAKFFEDINCRVVCFRPGVVLSSKGGILKKIAKFIKFYLGAPFGSGKQFISWIHIKDLCKMYIHAIEQNHWKGVFNAVAPEQIKNKYFMEELSKSLNRKLLPFHIPSLLLKIIYGEMSIMLLQGSSISTKKIIKYGFTYQYPNLKSSLKEIYSK